MQKQTSQWQDLVSRTLAQIIQHCVQSFEKAKDSRVQDIQILSFPSFHFIKRDPSGGSLPRKPQKLVDLLAKNSNSRNHE